MALISDDDLRRVREATDLVDLVSARVVLKQKGRLFWGCCPFHDEKTPSFKIDPDTQLWHCFGCGKGGDVFGYVMEEQNLEFPEAVRELAERAHIELTETGAPGISRDRRERLKAAMREAEAFYHHELLCSREPGAAGARAYLSGRNFGSGPSKKWRLGWAPGRGALTAHLTGAGYARQELLDANLAVDRGGRLQDRFYERVMFPVHDLKGDTIAFGGRVTGDGEPKYLNSSETPIFHKSDGLFGIDRAKSAITTAAQAVVVEGYTDVIALHEAGVENAVATLGTALTAQHVKLLSRFARTIIYLFDGDEAGQRAAMRASEFIDWSSAIESKREPVDLRVCVLPDAKDPAEFVESEGEAGIRRVLDASEPLLAFSVNRLIDGYDLHKPEQKARALEKSLEILYPIRESVSARAYTNIIAERLDVTDDVVTEALARMRPPAHLRRAASNGRQASGADGVPDGSGSRGTGGDGTGGYGTGGDDARPLSDAAQRLARDEDNWQRSERELMALIVSNPSLIGEFGPKIAQIAFHDSDCESMSAALIALDPSATPDAALDAALAVCPSATDIVASAMPREDDMASLRNRARLILHTLRERDLNQQMRTLKSRMTSEPGLSTDELDALFEQTVALQKELAALRSG